MHVGDQPAAIERLRRIAAERRPGDGVLADFLAAYYEELPEFDSDDRRDADLYAVAAAHLAAGKTLHAGQTIVRVFAPDRDRDGWQSDRTVVLLLTADAPFSSTPCGWCWNASELPRIFWCTRCCAFDATGTTS